FSNLSVTINHSVLRYGSFLNAIIGFVIVAFAMFIVVKGYNAMRKPAEDEAPSDEVQLLTEIRDALRSRQS
ncbi:MAG: MscL family protein, partial [Actinobacteria bacterium]|nr:MscL family protein [Actinomycetota bacterium]